MDSKSALSVDTAPEVTRAGSLPGVCDSLSSRQSPSNSDTGKLKPTGSVYFGRITQSGTWSVHIKFSHNPLSTDPETPGGPQVLVGNASAVSEVFDSPPWSDPPRTVYRPRNSLESQFHESDVAWQICEADRRPYSSASS